MSIATPSLLPKATTSLRLIAATRSCHRFQDHDRHPLQHRTYHASPSRRRIRPTPSPHPRSAQHQQRQHRPFHTTTPLHLTKDPYKTLNIPPTSPAADIKKAYYALAKKYHPDTNKDARAKERFAEAQQAYEILSDGAKKAAWDRHGAAAFDHGADAPGGPGANPFAAGGGGGGGGAQGGFGAGFGAEFNFEDLFSAFGGTGARRGRGGGKGGAGPFQEETLVGENIEVQSAISFLDAARGVRKEVATTPLVQCSACGGGGLKKGARRTACTSCDGTGARVHFAQGGFQMASTCAACGGQGVAIPRGAECGACRGNGAVRERRTVSVDIPGGVEDGMRLRVLGEGDYPPTGQAANAAARATKGDLYVFIRVAPDKRFGRSGSDVLYTAAIPLPTALLGGEIRVPTLDGEVKVRVATGTGTGDKITLGGMGMRKLGGGAARRGSNSGDLRVEFKVQMPKYLSVKQRSIVEMLADEMGDVGAKRVVNVQRENGAEGDLLGKEPAPPGAVGQKNEGFLKSAWQKMTGKQEGGLKEGKVGDEKEGKVGDEKEVVEEPKKASGSGSA